MVFSSVLFLFAFLPAVLTVFFLLPKRYRYYLLLIANLFFYAWGEGRYVLLLLLFIIVNYLFGLAIMKSRANNNNHKRLLVLAIIFDLLILVYFKYSFFLGQNIVALFSFLGFELNIVPHTTHLPIGVSFFTFQAISYLIDVYRNEVKATKSLFNFALYKSFFPQLIAGPIIRYKDVGEQFESKPDISADDFLIGTQRFIVGLGKKVIVANTVAVIADRVFGLPVNQLSMGSAWLGAFCYSVQIYFDFSGYSDMAIGLARMFGFRFLENFNYPYIASSVQDFWRRWHISLSSWFRDYLYIPLGGSRYSQMRTYLNQMIVFLLCGLWHGPSWSFVVWGGWHGCFLILERTKFGSLIKKWGFLSHIYTLIAVIIGWVIFRSENISYAIGFLKVMFGLQHNVEVSLTALSFLNSEIVVVLLVSILASIPFLTILKRVSFKASFIQTEFRKSLLLGVTFLLYVSVFLYSIILLSSGTYNPFIYFRF